MSAFSCADRNFDVIEDGVRLARVSTCSRKNPAVSVACKKVILQSDIDLAIAHNLDAAMADLGNRAKT